MELCGINVVRKTHKRHELIRKNAKGLGKSIFLRIINGLGEAKALINEIDDSRLRLAEIMLTLIAGRWLTKQTSSSKYTSWITASMRRATKITEIIQKLPFSLGTHTADAFSHFFFKVYVLGSTARWTNANFRPLRRCGWGKIKKQSQLTNAFCLFSCRRLEDNDYRYIHRSLGPQPKQWSGIHWRVRVWRRQFQFTSFRTISNQGLSRWVLHLHLFFFTA